MLSLAVSASAFAGVNAQQITKGQRAMDSKKAVVTLNESYPGIMKMSHKKANHYGFKAEPLQRVMSRDVVTEQPEGTVQYYKRTAGTAVWVSADDYYTPGDQDGYVMTVQNGNTYWFKNILYDPDGYFGDYWVKGTKSGNYVTVELGQAIADFGAYGECLLDWATTAISNYSITFTHNESVSTVRYRVGNNGSLTLQGTSTVDDGYGYSGTGFACHLPGYTTNPNIFMGFIEFGTVLSVADDVPETPTMYTDAQVEALEGDEVAYYRKGYAFVYDEEGDSIALVAQSGYAWIYYADDGSVYMRDPVYGFKTNKWVKGTKDGNKITIPLGQYIYWSSAFQGLKTAWGEMGEEDFTYDTAGEVTYTIDDQTITLDGCEYSETSIKGLALVLDSAYVDKGFYGYLDLFTTYYVFPDAPENVRVTPAATTADVSWEPGTLTQWNLRYREHVEGAEYYSTGFETDEDLEGWHGWDADGDGYWWGLRELDNGQCLTSASWRSDVGVLTPDNWLVSPQITLNGVFRFKAWGQDPSYPSEIIRAYVSTTTDSVSAMIDLSDDITVVAYDSIGNGAANTYSFDLSAYAGQQGYVAIRHYNISDMFMVNLDDVYVGNPDVVVPEWNYVNGITEIPYTITGLTPETTYEVQMQSVNAGGTGDWGELTLFTTLAEVGYLRGDVDGSGTVDITDATTLINYLLNGSANPFVEDNADVDYSGGIDISDATTLINFLLTGNWPN